MGSYLQQMITVHQVLEDGSVHTLHTYSVLPCHVSLHKGLFRTRIHAGLGMGPTAWQAGGCGLFLVFRYTAQH